MTTTELKLHEWVEWPDEAPGSRTSINERDGLIAFVEIENDGCGAENPLDWDCNGTIHSLGRRHSNYNPSAVEDAVENDPDHVILSYFEHGTCRWFVMHDHSIVPYIPPMYYRFDCVERAGVWVPDDTTRKEAPTDPEERRAFMVERASSVCEVYSHWCNGHVYGYTLKVYMYDEELGDDSDDYEGEEPLADDSCCGFYGFDLDGMKWNAGCKKEEATSGTPA